MAYTYNQLYDQGYTLNGEDVWFDPTMTVPVESDHDDYGQTLQQVKGWSDADVSTFVTARKWEQVRAYRDELLKESDWTQGDDVPSSIKTPYQTYRQSLRDITTGSDPDALTWPTKP